MRHATNNGFFEVVPMPAQPQLAICHGFGVPEDRRGQGCGHALKREQIAMLHANHYDAAICTVRDDNVHQHAILTAAGYQRVGGFRDRRQACDVGIWLLVLSPERGDTARQSGLLDSRLSDMVEQHIRQNGPIVVDYRNDAFVFSTTSPNATGY